MKKTVIALLLVGLCFGGPAAQAKDWQYAPFSEVKQSAEQGDAEAQLQLGKAYSNGRGVAQDYRQAATWVRKAAEQGHADAQYPLGLMYASGKGVIKDYKLAYAWLSVAAANGNSNAPALLDRAAELLTPEVLADAQELAGEYVEKYQPKS